MSQWKNIEAKYEPDEWINFLKTKYAKEYEESLRMMLQKDEFANDEQLAEQKLEEMMMKSSLTQRALDLFGEKRIGELFELIESKMERGDKPLPFKNAQELEEFCCSMSPIILYTEIGGKVKNSGQGFRMFARYIKKRLELGDVVDDYNINEILDNFYETIEPANCTSKMLDFKRKEVLLDFSELEVFAKRVQGFQYVDSKLTLSPEASRFALELPILNYSIDTEHPSRIDRSRIISGVMRTLFTRTMDLKKGDLVNHPILTMQCVVKGSRFPHADSEKFVDKIKDFNFFLVYGYIAPNTNEQVQVFRFTPIEDIGEFIEVKSLSFKEKEERQLKMKENTFLGIV